MRSFRGIRCAVAVLLCVLLTLCTAGCSQPISVDPTTLSPEYPVTVNEVTIETKPQKVAVLSGSLADVVLAIGYETSLVLGSEDCTQPELQVLQKIAPDDVAAIIEAKADLVLAESMEESTRAELEAAGVKVLVLNRAKNREDFERLYSEVGTALNGTTTGNNAGIKAAQKIFSSLDDLARLVPETNVVITACYISELNGAAVTGEQLGSVMMSYMGLTNVFKGVEGGFFLMDDLKLSDPTMIFCTEEVAAQLMADEAYAGLTAVQTDRVYAIDPHYMDWQGKTVYTAAIEMMGLAYPELTETSEASVTVPTATPEPTPEPTLEPSEEPTASPEPTPVPELDPIPSGDQGEHVFLMQERLAAYGYLTTEYDGYYGKVTIECVKAFQAANGLEATGEADSMTLALLYWDQAIAADGTVGPISAYDSDEGTSEIPEEGAGTGGSVGPH